MVTITQIGLKKHLEARVFVGDSEREVLHFVLGNDNSVMAGFLCSLDSNFYVQLHERGRAFRGAKWTDTGKRYLLRERDIIAIEAKDHLRFYEVSLK